MNDSTSKLLIVWLKNANYIFDEQYFLQQFLSHPDAPGVSAITDTLNDLSIENMAIEIPFSELPKLEEPFMAYIRQNREEQFALVHKQSNNTWKIKLKADGEITISSQKFKELFTGLAVLIDTAQKKPARTLQPQYIIPSLIVLSFISIFILQPAPVTHFIFSVTGLLVSILITAKELGMNTGRLDKLCRLSSATDCEAVLQSSYSNIFGIKLFDLSIIFFAWQTFAWLFIYPLHPAVASYLYAISIVVMPVTFASVYLQKFVLKIWCPLCLLICAALWAQAITGALAFFYGGRMEFSPPATLTLIIALATLGAAWQFIKQLLQKTSKNQVLNTQLLSFRRNYRLFMPMYRQLPTVQTSIAGMRDITLGAADATAKMIVISNPMCTACISLHKQLHKWLKQYRELSVTIRFYVPVENTNDKRTLVAAKLVELYMNNAQAGLNEIDAWYEEPDFDKFYARNSRTHHKDALQIIKQHRKWCHDNNILVTPSVIINEKRFPVFYEPEDVRFFLDELVKASSEVAVYPPPGTGGAQRCTELTSINSHF